MNLSQLFDGFLLDVEADGEVGSEETVKWYRRRLSVFSKWIIEQQKDGECLTRNAFTAYVAHRKEMKLKPTTRRADVIVLRRFGRWLVANGHLETYPAAHLKPPKLGKNTRPRAITREDAQAIIAAAEANLRDHALTLMLFQSGVRVGELVNMTWKDVNLGKRQALVCGKGRKHRLVFFQTDAARAMIVYRETVPHQENDPVWWSRSNPTHPLTYSGVYLVLKRLAECVDVEDFIPHCWRHAFGRDMTLNGCPTLALQDLMGHESPETTKIYTQFQEHELKILYDQHARGGKTNNQPRLPGF